VATVSLRRLARFARRKYWSIFAVVAVLVAASLVSASRLRFDTDVLGLLPKNDPVVLQYQETLSEFGSLDYFLVVVRVPEDAALPRYEMYVDLLGQRLETVDGLEGVQYQFGRLQELIAEFMPSAVVFLNQADLETLASKVTEEALRERAEEIRRIVSTPQSLIAKEVFRFDPLGLSEIFLHQLENSRAGLALDWSSGYFLSSDRRMFLLVAKPTRPAQDVGFARRLVADVEEEVRLANDDWRRSLGEETAEAPKVDLGGRHIIGIADAGLIQRDVIANVLTSMIGVLLLFLLAFRRFGPLLYAFIPLTCGLVLTFGFSSLAFGTMSAATSGVAALLIGLGIDFVIVSYGRFVEERRRGLDLDEALARMSGSSGRAVVIGGVTSAATFYAFGVTDFTGLLQMGYLTGTGILFCMAAVLLLLPAMLAWSEDRHTRRRSIPRRMLHGFGSGRLIPICVRHPRLVLSVGLVITAVAAIMATGLEFEDSVQAMRPRGNPGVEIRDEVAERFGVGFDQMMLVVEGRTLDEVLESAARVGGQASDLVARGILRDVDGIDSIIPPLVAQQRALEWLATERAKRIDIGRIRQQFEHALAAEGMRIGPFEEGLELFRRAIGRSEPVTVAEIQETLHGTKLLERYLRPKDEGWKSVVYLFPPPKTWRREAPPEAHELVSVGGGGSYLTGSNVLSHFLRKRVLRDAVLAAVLGLLIVSALLWLDFGRFGETLFSLAPLLIGLVWMLGAMAALEIPMNFMNIFVSTMIIGIGVDYGVHMIHRYREFSRRAPDRVQEGLVETGKAITLAAMSTIVGFGSLSRSHYPGLSSMGLVAILGAVSTCLVAITMLPAFLELWDERRGRSLRD
jgi:predicted RND superfamily exporter protein